MCPCLAALTSVTLGPEHHDGALVSRRSPNANPLALELDPGAHRLRLVAQDQGYLLVDLQRSRIHEDHPAALGDHHLHQLVDRIWDNPLRLRVVRRGQAQPVRPEPRWVAEALLHQERTARPSAAMRQT